MIDLRKKPAKQASKNFFQQMETCDKVIYLSAIIFWLAMIGLVLHNIIVHGYHNNIY